MHCGQNDSVSRSGIATLYNRFLSLATHRDKTTNEHFLTEVDFQSIAELQQNPLGQRIIDAFFADANVVERRKVYFRDFVKVLSRFRPINRNKPHPWNSREAKLRCMFYAFTVVLLLVATEFCDTYFIVAFTMYDLNKSGTITKDEFKDILKIAADCYTARSATGKARQRAEDVVTAKRIARRLIQ
uniref:EF-hand domain-containing protein n=1 Tax=Angiostrongylus cantonensis TaxID=6313 RepID=A0A158PA94_ANGCA